MGYFLQKSFNPNVRRTFNSWVFMLMFSLNFIQKVEVHCVTNYTKEMGNQWSNKITALNINILRCVLRGVQLFLLLCFFGCKCSGILTVTYIKLDSDSQTGAI